MARFCWGEIGQLSTQLQMELPVPRTKLFVGHLPDGCSSDHLFKLFSRYGTVKECDVINKYGFVHMSKPEEAEEAIKRLNNHKLMGCAISVEPSKSTRHLQPGDPGRARGGTNESVPDRRGINGSATNEVQQQQQQQPPQANWGSFNEFQLFDSPSNNSPRFMERPSFGQSRIQTQSHSLFEQPSSQWRSGNFRAPSAGSASASSMKPLMEARGMPSDHVGSSHDGNSGRFQFANVSTTAAFANDFCRSALVTPAVASHNPYAMTTLTSPAPSQQESLDRYVNVAASMLFPSRTSPRTVETVSSQNRPWFYATSANMTPNQPPTDFARSSFY